MGFLRGFSIVGFVENYGLSEPEIGITNCMSSYDIKNENQKQMASILLCKKSTSYWDERCSGNNWLNYFGPIYTISLEHIPRSQITVAIQLDSCLEYNPENWDFYFMKNGKNSSKMLPKKFKR